MKHQLHPIRNESDYEAALNSEEGFFGYPIEPDPNGAEESES
mgnify:CR=1 FL=1